jgi:hypothetical protein
MNAKATVRIVTGMQCGLTCPPVWTELVQDENRVSCFGPPGGTQNWPLPGIRRRGRSSYRLGLLGAEFHLPK